MVSNQIYTDIFSQSEVESANYDFNQILELIKKSLLTKGLYNYILDIDEFKNKGAYTISDFLNNTYSVLCIKQFCREFDIYNKSVLIKFMKEFEKGKTLNEVIDIRFSPNLFKKLEKKKTEMMKEISGDPKNYDMKKFDRQFNLLDEVFIDDEFYKYFITCYLIYNTYQLITINSALNKVKETEKYKVIDKYAYNYHYTDIIISGINTLIGVFMHSRFMIYN